MNSLIFYLLKWNRNTRNYGVVLRGARGPVDLGFAPTEAERRPNPPLATRQKVWKPRGIKVSSFFIQKYLKSLNTLCNYSNIQAFIKDSATLHIFFNVIQVAVRCGKYRLMTDFLSYLFKAHSRSSKHGNIGTANLVQGFFFYSC